jgi:glycosyltransferase involved in cell wall biosynthesis
VFRPAAAAWKTAPVADRPTIALVSDAAGYGGAQVYLSQLATHLGERWRFVVLVGDEVADETVRRLTAAGAEVRRVPGVRRIPRPGAILALARALRDVRPALVHVGLTDQGDGLGPLLAARVARRPLLATLHLVVPQRQRRREWVSAFALRLPRLVIGVSESVAAYVRSRGGRATVVLNGIDPPELLPDARAQLDLPADALVVGGIGRIDEQKGWDVLCDAMAAVRTSVPTAVAVVLGDGPGLAELQERGGDAVRFVGYRERASSYLPAFDVLAVPSRYEAFGRVAAEAMLGGVPVVASAVDGLPEVVGDAGVLVRPDRPEVLAEALVRLLSDPGERAALAAAGKARATERFAAERMVGEVERVYRELGR